MTFLIASSSRWLSFPGDSISSLTPFPLKPALSSNRNTQPFVRISHNGSGLDAKNAQLITQLKAPNGHIKVARALLLPSKSPLKYSNGEVLSLVSIALSSRFL
jgi:hypothetical protein